MSGGGLGLGETFWSAAADRAMGNSRNPNCAGTDIRKKKGDFKLDAETVKIDSYIER